METTLTTDYFAPLGSHTRIIGLRTIRESMLIASLPPVPFSPLQSNRIVQLDPADRFTYIIMGLAVFISILVPVLNWH